MGKVVYRGHIDGPFYGFDDGAVFKTEDGTYWRQARFRYWEHEEYMPEVVIEEVDGALVMTVAGESELVERIDDVEEAEIEGEFVGWDGTKRYTLSDGSEWEEYGYRYKFRYAYNPDVVLVRIGESTIMHVKGVHARVKPAGSEDPVVG